MFLVSTDLRGKFSRRGLQKRWTSTSSLRCGFCTLRGLLQTRNPVRLHRAGVHDSTIKTGSNHGNAQLVAHVFGSDDSTEDEVDIGGVGPSVE